jgi:hypothetical protein
MYLKAKKKKLLHLAEHYGGKDSSSLYTKLRIFHIISLSQTLQNMLQDEHWKFEHNVPEALNVMRV